MNPQELEAERDLVLKAAPSIPSPLPEALLCNPQTQASKLLNNQDADNTLTVTDQKLELAFKEPVWIEDIRITYTTAPDGDDAELQLHYKPAYATDLVQTAISKEALSKQYVARINDLVNAVEITAAQDLPNTPLKLRDITINGYSKADIPSLSSGIHEFNQHLRKFEQGVQDQINELHSREQKLSALHRQVNHLQKERDALANETARLEAQKAALGESNSNSLARLRKSREDEARLASKLRKIKTGSGIKKQLQFATRQSAIDSSTDAEELHSRQEPAADELYNYEHQSIRSAIQYLAVSVVPMLVIAGVAYMLFHSASELSFDIKQFNSGGQAMNLFLARLPFTTLSLFLAYCSWYLARMLISRVAHIHDERIRIAKLAILAREVTDGAAEDLDVPVETQLAIRAQLKMDLLKTYFENDLGRDYRFVYHPARERSEPAPSAPAAPGRETQKAATTVGPAVTDLDTERSLASRMFTPA